jgi:hypothetical protein
MHAMGSSLQVLVVAWCSGHFVFDTGAWCSGHFVPILALHCTCHYCLLPLKVGIVLSLAANFVLADSTTPSM